MRNVPWHHMIVVVVVLGALAGCSSNPEPKTAGYNAASPSNPQPGATPKDQKAVDAQPPPPPPPPAQLPPSTKYMGWVADYNGVNTPIKGGENFTINARQMLFFYSLAASPDCGNVTTEGLLKRSNAGICQAGLLPIEQGIKSGTKDVSLAVNGEKVTFKVTVTAM